MKHSTEALLMSATAATKILSTKPEIEARIRFSGPALGCMASMLEGIAERDQRIAELEIKLEEVLTAVKAEGPVERQFRERYKAAEAKS